MAYPERIEKLKGRGGVDRRMRSPPLRAACIVATIAALVNLVVAPFHAAAYFATEDGSEDLLAHQVAMGEAIRGALPSLYAGDAYDVYLALGKLTALAVAGLAFAFAGLHGAQDAALPRARRIVGRVLVGVWALFGALAVGEYFTPLTDVLFLAAIPTLLALLVLTGLYGWWTARSGVLPRRVGWAFFAAALAFIPLVIAFGHVPFGLYGFSLAWLSTVPVLWRLSRPDRPTGS